jgi:hypothetical protein
VFRLIEVLGKIRITGVIRVISVLSVNRADLQAKVELPELLALVHYLNQDG